MIVKLLTEHRLEFLSLKRGCRGSSESTLVKLLEISCRGSIINLLSGIKENGTQLTDSQELKKSPKLNHSGLS